MGYEIEGEYYRKVILWKKDVCTNSYRWKSQVLELSKESNDLNFKDAYFKY